MIMSIGVLIASNHPQRLADDFHVEPGGPVAQILQIELHALAHLVDRLGLAAQTIHLREPRDARSDLVADHVAVYELAILLIVSHSVRPGPYDAHGALEHVQELWQLVQRRGAQDAAER